MKHTQTANDFITSRTLEKNELIRRIGGQNFGTLQYGYGMPLNHPNFQGYPPRPDYPPY